MATLWFGCTPIVYFLIRSSPTPLEVQEMPGTHLYLIVHLDSIEVGQNPQIVHFFGKTCTVRRSDGAIITASIPPYPIIMYSYCEKGDWENAVRLCRFVKVREPPVPLLLIGPHSVVVFGCNGH
jgi:hypothetical protein